MSGIYIGVYQWCNNLNGVEYVAGVLHTVEVVLGKIPATA